VSDVRKCSIIIGSIFSVGWIEFVCMGTQTHMYVPYCSMH